MSYIYLGKIVNTHGIKGEVRILSNFIYKDLIFKKNFKVYIGKEKKEEEILTYRKHKQFDMLTFIGYTNINEVLKYKGQNIYFKKEDLKLEEGKYLDEDLINLKAMFLNKEIGFIKRIERYEKNCLIVIENNKLEYLVPYHDNFIEKIDLTKKIIVFKNIEGLIR